MTMFYFSKMKTWQRISIILVAVVVLLRIGYIGFRGEINKEYIKSYTYDLSEYTYCECNNFRQEFSSDYSRLNSLELVFDNIAPDKNGKIILSIEDSGETVYQTNLSLDKINNWEWKKVYVNMPLEKNKKYVISMATTEDCTQMPYLLVVRNGNAAEIIGSYTNGEQLEGQATINYGYLREPSLCDKATSIGASFIMGIILMLGIANYYSAKNCFGKLFDKLTSECNITIAMPIIEVLLCLYIVWFSGIEFQKATIMVMLVVSLLGTLGYKKKADYVLKLADATWKGYLINFVYLYAAFSLVGQRVFIYPFIMRTSLVGLSVFVAALIWFIPIIKSCFYWAESFSATVIKNDSDRLKTWKITFCVVIILTLPVMISLAAFNPGISTEDTIQTMIVNAQNIHGMYDWHPFFYCWSLNRLIKIWNSTYCIIIVQCFFYVYVVTEFLLYLRKKSVRDSVLFFLASFIGFNPANYIYINTICKDVPYTLAVFWIFIILMKLTMDGEEYKKKWYIYIEFITATVALALYRKNGIVTFIMIVVCLIPYALKYKKILVSIVFSILLIAMVKGPMYKYYEVEGADGKGTFIALGQDILGAYYNDGEISEQTLKNITLMTGQNNAEYRYVPTWALQSEDVRIEPRDFVKCYLDTFFKNPIIVTRAVIDRQDGIWDIYEGLDSTYFSLSTGTMDNDDGNPYNPWNDYYPRRQYISLYTPVSNAIDYMINSQWISAVFLRTGFMLLLGVVAISFMVIKKKTKHLLIMLSPTIGHVLGLFAGCGWAPFRYYWVLNFLNLAFMIYMLIGIHEEKMQKGILDEKYSNI